MSEKVYVAICQFLEITSFKLVERMHEIFRFLISYNAFGLNNEEIVLPMYIKVALKVPRKPCVMAKPEFVYYTLSYCYC